MTGSLRSTARNPIAIALMGVLVLVFLILGIGGGGGRITDSFRGVNSQSVVTAGQQTMTPREFKRQWDRAKEQIEQRNQVASLDPELLVKNGVDQQLLLALTQQYAEVEMLRRAGIVPGDSLVDAEIKKLPIAFDRVSGKFNQQQFLQYLNAQQITPREIQEQVRDGIAQQHLAYVVEAGFQPPRTLAAPSTIRLLQNRDISYFFLDPRLIATPKPPTDADLEAFIKAHAAEMKAPEMRVITLVRFSSKALEPTVTINPADVQKAFDFKKDSLSAPEKRSLVQIPVKTAAQGAQAAARLAKGEDPAAVAKALGVDPIVYVDKPQSAIADRKLAAAAFALANGQVSGVIQGDLGMGVVKIQQVTPGHQASFETERPRIEAELRAKAAEDRIYEITQKFEDARDAGASVVDAAKKAGAATITVGPVTAQNQDIDGKPIPAVTAEILKSAFDLPSGGESELENPGQGEYFALHVDRVIPPTLPKVAERRAQLTALYLREKVVEAVRAKAEALVAIARTKGIEAAAAQANGHIVHQPGLQAVRAQQYKPYGDEFVGQIFEAKPGDAFAAGTPAGVVIARLDAVRPENVTTTAQMLEQLRGRIAQDYVHELQGQIQAAAQKAIKARSNIALARSTIGVDPAGVSDKPGSKPSGLAK